MKGRSQGGGPAVSKKTQKRKKEFVRAEVVRVKRKIYQEGRSKPKAPWLGLKRQLDRHLALLDQGAERWPVYTRVNPTVDRSADAHVCRDDHDGSSWLEVGAVSFESGIQPAAAVWLHKRLILEHACRLYPKLSPHADDLEMGLVSPSSNETQFPIPEVVLRMEPAPEKGAGFSGLPDPFAGHYFAESEQSGNEGKQMLDDRRGLAATKAATAMSFSKSLGLRSG